jgi:hypothetical protein
VGGDAEWVAGARDIAVSETATLEKPHSEAAGGAAGAGADWRNPALLCLAGAVVCSGALVLFLESHLTFLADDWAFVLQRRGSSVGTFLDPHADHIALAPVAIYKLLLATFGMDSALPFQVVSTSVFLLAAVLLFVYLRQRVGAWPALLGTCLILFLGAAWIDLLWPFQIGYSAPIAAGLGALLVLDREDRLGDLIACALLVVAISFSELGMPFVAGTLVRLLLNRKPAVKRLYVALVPLALYAAWWLGWGHTAPSAFSLHNVLVSPKYAFDAVSQAMASLFGLATPLSGNAWPGGEGWFVPVGLNWGRILLVTAIGLAVWRLRRVGGAKPGLWVALAIGGTFWFGTAFNTFVLRPPTNGRYVYPSAVFVLLIAAELLAGARVGRRTLALAATVTVAAVISGVLFLRLGYRDQLEPRNDATRAGLAAVEIARQTVNPRFTVRSILVAIQAAPYLSAVDAFGSPAYSEQELASGSQLARGMADRTLASALGIGLRSARRGSSAPESGRDRGRGCRTVEATPTGSTALELRPGRFTLQDRSAPGALVELARFSSRPSLSRGPLPPGRVVSLEIPRDLSTRPWRVGFRGSARVTLCDVGPG